MEHFSECSTVAANCNTETQIDMRGGSAGLLNTSLGDHGLDEGLGVGHEVRARGRRSGGVVVVVVLGDSDGLGQLDGRRRRRSHCGIVRNKFR